MRNALVPSWVRWELVWDSDPERFERALHVVSGLHFASRPRRRPTPMGSRQIAPSVKKAAGTLRNEADFGPSCIDVPMGSSQSTFAALSLLDAPALFIPKCRS